MSLTHFQHGISSMGVPVLGGQALMTQGDSYFVDPLNGDDGNDGKSADHAFATLTAGYAALTANQNDVLYYLAGSTGINLTATLTWAKAYTHLVGVCSPSMLGQRARIMQDSTATAVATLFSIEAAGCSFRNLYFFQGVANAAVKVCVNLASTTSRNYFENVHFAGIGNATMDVNGAASLKIDGADENTFVNCAIGLDTTDAGSAATNSEILFDDEASKNFFIDCLIYRRIEHDTNHPLVNVNDSLGIGAQNWFKRCLFQYSSTNEAYHGTSVFLIPAISSKTRRIILQSCMAVSGNTVAIAWDSASRGVTLADMPTTAATAGGGLATVI